MNGSLYKGESVLGWYWSEKLDGTRVYWDGGVSRGMLAGDVPWANCVKGGADVECSGFWSRYWKPIVIEEYTLDRIIEEDLCGYTGCLDGEFYLGRGRFEESRSYVSRVKNLLRWPEALRFYAFDVPTYASLFSTREIRCPDSKKGYKHKIDWDSCLAFLEAVGVDSGGGRGRGRDLIGVRGLLKYKGINSVDFAKVGGSGCSGCSGGEGGGSDSGSDNGLDDLFCEFDEIVAGGGEGVMLRAPGVIWSPGRTRKLLKLKKEERAEAEVTGYQEGLGKYSGKVGSLEVRMLTGTCKGQDTTIGGLYDWEREYDKAQSLWPVGSKVPVVFMEKTKKGAPRSGRICRIRAI